LGSTGAKAARRMMMKLTPVLNQFSALEQLRLAQGDESVFAHLEKLITILGSTEVKASHRKSLMQVLSRHLGADNVLIMFALVIFLL